MLTLYHAQLSLVFDQRKKTACCCVSASVPNGDMYSVSIPVHLAAVVGAQQMLTQQACDTTVTCPLQQAQPAQ